MAKQGDERKRITFPSRMLAAQRELDSVDVGLDHAIKVLRAGTPINAYELMTSIRKLLVLAAVDGSEGNHTRAARQLGIERATFHRWLTKPWRGY